MDYLVHGDELMAVEVLALATVCGGTLCRVRAKPRAAPGAERSGVEGGTARPSVAARLGPRGAVLKT